MFYGWWIVGASFLTALCVGGVVFYGFTAIFEPIAKEFGWSYAQISLAASLRSAEAGFLSPIAGILTDRWGPRRAIFSGGIITASGLMVLSHTTSLGMFYGAFVLVGIGMSACGMVVLTAATAKWFRRKIGIAVGIAISGFGFGGLLIPVIVRLVDIYQWRMTMTILALSLLSIVLPLSLLFRHKPEQYGYLVNGEVKSTSQRPELNVKVKQVLRSRTFWHIALAFSYYTAALDTMAAHVMPYLSSIGITRSRSSLVASAIPLMSVVGRLGLGWLGDKVTRKWISAGSFALMGLGVLCFEYVSIERNWLLVLFIVLFGLGYGGNITNRASLVRDFFGRANFGTALGLITSINMLIGIMGAPLTGWIFDNQGSYDGIWLVFAIVSVVPLILIATTPEAAAFFREECDDSNYDGL